MAKPRRKRPKTRPAKGRPAGSGPLRQVLALLLVLGTVGLLAWLVRQRAGREGGDAQRLEQAVRQVMDRLQLSQATFQWEEEPEPTLVVRLQAGPGFPRQRFALELEAAIHNLGGQLHSLPLLEAGGYGLGAYQGRLGQTKLRVLVLAEAPPKPQRSLPASRTGKLAVVLDDAGNSLEVLPVIDALPEAVAVAVLPNAPASAATAQALRQRGREVLLHMPMEPNGNGGAGPGEGALHVGMGEEEVAQRLAAALKVVGPVAGVNNHMGSRATSDEALMNAFAQAMKGRNLYFLDSKTTPASVAEQVLHGQGIRTLHRDTFLDVVVEEAAIRSALATAVSLARAHGRAVAIGHVHPLTLRVLAASLGRLSGVDLVRPSALLDGNTP